MAFFVRNIGRFGGANGQFLSLRALTLDGAGNLYAADSGSSNIKEFDSNGTFIQNIGARGISLNSPFGGAFDSSGNLYVTDNGNSRIVKFDAVPEPGDIALFVGMASVGVGVFRRRRR